MTMRLFAAVVPPPSVLSELDALVDPRRDADRNLRWVLPESWHLTLAFFGDVPDDRVELLQQVLDAVRGAPFTVTLGGAGTFPNPVAARVLYQAVTDGGDDFAALGRRVRTAADRVGVPSDNAKHIPHLTLARTRRPADLTRWLRIVESFPAQSFSAESFSLIHSDLRPARPQYRPLLTFALGDRPQSE